MTRRQRLLEWPYWQQVCGGIATWGSAFGITRRPASTTGKSIWRRLHRTS